MRHATILLLVDSSVHLGNFAPIVDNARDLSAHLSVMVVGAMPRMPVYSYGFGDYGAIAVPENWMDGIEAERARLDATAETLRDDLGRRGCSADVEVLLAEPVALDAAVARRGLTCDLVAILRERSDSVSLAGRAGRAVLFQTPGGLLIGADAPHALRPKRVFLAWNGGLPAARAAHAALTLLQEAEEVTVAIFGPVATLRRGGGNPGSDMARWLSHHGCKVDVQHYPVDDVEIGQAILDRAREIGSDLVVMGAYEHSRMRELILGGTTRTMIEQTALPVLFAH